MFCVFLHFLVPLLFHGFDVVGRHPRAPGRLPEGQDRDGHLLQQHRHVIHAEQEAVNPHRTLSQEKLHRAHHHGHHDHADKKAGREDKFGEGYVNQIIDHDDRREDRHEQADIEEQRRKGFLPPDKGSGVEGLPQPGPLPPHLLLEKDLVVVGYDRRANGRVLIIGPVMAQHDIGQGPVVSKGRLLTKEALVKPFVQVLEYEFLSVAGQGPGQAGDTVEKALRRLHDAESDIVSHRLQLGQGIGIGVRRIGPAITPAIFGSFGGLDEVADRERFQKAVRIDKAPPSMLCPARTNTLRRASRLPAFLGNDTADPLPDMEFLFLGLFLAVDRSRDFFNGVVGGLVVDDDDLQLFPSDNSGWYSSGSSFGSTSPR